MRFLRDAASFVETSYLAMEHTPPHIYLSALPFAPKDSLIYRDFFHLCTNVVSVEAAGINRHGGNLVMTLIGHESKVTTVVHSPNGLFLASGSEDGSIRFWDTRTGEEALSPIRSGDSEITSITFSPDGKLIASGTKAGHIHLLDTRTGHDVPSTMRSADSETTSFAFSPDGKCIALGTKAGHVHLLDTLKRQLLAVLKGHTKSVGAVAFHPDGHILASGSRDGTVRRWDVRTREPKGVAFADSESWVTSLAFASDGSAVAVGIFCLNHQVRVWSAGFEGGFISVIKMAVRPISVTFSSDSLRLFTSDANDTTSWNWRSGEMLSTVSPALAKTISYSADGSFIASISDSLNICIRNTQSLHDSAQNLHAHNGGVNAVALSVDGCTIASASEDGTVGLWNARSGEAVLPPLQGHIGAVNSVVISPNGRLVVSASADSTIRIWDIATGAPVGEPLRGHDGSINALAFSPDGMWLASAGSDEMVRFWQIPLGAPSAEPPKLLLASCELQSLAYSPDGSIIAAGDKLGYISVWSTTQDEGHKRSLRRPSNAVRVRSIAFSPDGNFIVGAFKYSIRAWNARKHDGQVAWELEGHSGVLTVQFSPSGQHIVSGADDGTICIWDAETKTIQHRLDAHGASIRSAFMTPDHLRLVSCSEDGTIRVWNLAGVTVPVSESGRGPLSNLALLGCEDDWLVGPSDELLLWVPNDYINNLVIGGMIETLIAKYKVVLTIPDGGSCDGTNWTACWSG